MEDSKFNPETHREDYALTEKELLKVKGGTIGEKSDAELAELIAKRAALTASLEAQEAEARDHADEDNENLTDASVQIEKLKKEIEGYKDQIAEIAGVTEEERGGGVSPELAETIALLKDAGYLDTSFEGKEFHPLTIRPLTEEEALDEYKKSGDRAWIWDELEKNMPYVVPKAEILSVMIMNFYKSESIESDDALAEMEAHGVRPLTYEELIQYGIKYPKHQKQKALVGLGTKQTLVGYPYAPNLRFDDDVRVLSADLWGNDWVGRYRFPGVRK